MALDRQSIEKKDFPIGRRGYDPEAVDSHLAALAEEIEELKRSSRRRTETLASAASEQVRAIVEAAETSAAEIQRQAEEEARDIRADASSEAKSTREQAAAEAKEYVGKVSESTAVMLQRLDGMEGELSALIESLRTGANRLNADLQLLEGNLGEVREAVSPRPRFEPEASRGGAALEEEDVGGFDEEEYEETVGEASAAEAAEETLGTSEDTEGARLIALNMALNGTPREETDRYLAENFELPDRDGLLDEVYASVES